MDLCQDHYGPCLVVLEAVSKAVAAQAQALGPYLTARLNIILLSTQLLQKPAFPEPGLRAPRAADARYGVGDLSLQESARVEFPWTWPSMWATVNMASGF